MSSIRPRRAYPNLRAYFEATDTTHQWFAELVGVSRVTITDIANRREQPSLPLALKIAELANVPVESLLKESGR